MIVIDPSVSSVCLHQLLAFQLVRKSIVVEENALPSQYSLSLSLSSLYHSGLVDNVR